MRFSGVVGFGHSVEKAAGVWEDEITEKPYFGDVVRNTRQLVEGDKVLPDLSVQNSISIVADAYANEHFFAMRYVVWQGARWVVADVDASAPPRLILRLGGVYNGPTPAPVTP